MQKITVLVIILIIILIVPQLSVDWENNESVDALRDLVSKGELTINMSAYGGFEQAGPIGQELPGNDQQIQANAGDIVLYSGNQMVVFYGSNSWAYTKPGHLTDKTPGEMKELLSNGDVTITLTTDNRTKKRILKKLLLQKDQLR